MLQIEFDAQEIETALPDYRYVSRLGSGTFATVHLVAHRKTNQQMALKKISCFGLGDYQKSGAANEVRILGSLEHKNIIKVNSSLFDNNEDMLYIFMEYACSGDLTHLIEQAKQKRKRIPEATVWKALSDISDGLQYLHLNQILHRDLKPANIFRADRNFKIGDMNVSKVLKAGSMATTKTGSPLYTAPQVWQDESYNEKCDIWSLGVLTYELCSLKVPFQASSIDELLNKTKATAKSKTIPSVYSSELDDLVHRMLQLRPEKRIPAEQIFKIAQEKLKIQTQTSTQPLVENLMQTIVFPETHQRWINLIPLPPKTCRKQSNAGSVKSIKKQSSRSRCKSRSNRKHTELSQEKEPKTIFQNVKPPMVLVRNKSKSKNGDSSISRNGSVNRLPPVKLPSIHRKNSGSGFQEYQSELRRMEGREKSKSRDKSRSRDKSMSRDKSRDKNDLTEKTRDSSSSARINRKIVEKYLNSAKQLISRDQ